MVKTKTRNSNLRDKVLDAIRIGYPNTSEYTEYPEGNSMKGIASCIYGPEAIYEISEEGRILSGALNTPLLKNSTKATLTRTLKKLWIDGLILKCLPVFRTYWKKKCVDDENFGDVGFTKRVFAGVVRFQYDLEGSVRFDALGNHKVTHKKKVDVIQNFVSSSGFYKWSWLSRTKIWWMLVE